ncbi:FG-GAP repeat domain-containing protein [Acidobacteriota bacterium]
MVMLSATFWPYPLEGASPPGYENALGCTYGAYGRLSWPGSLDIDAEADLALHHDGDLGTGYPAWNLRAWDLNGDGFDDVVSAAFLGLMNNEGRTGKIFIQYGSDTVDLVVDYSAGQGDIILYGEDSDLPGYAMTYGDLNGDSRQDFVVCAAGGDGPDDLRMGCTECYIFLGSECRARAQIQPAGPHTLCQGATVVLTGAQSTLTDCNAPLYEWSVDGSPPAGKPDPSFVVPADLGVGTHEVHLAVSCQDHVLCTDTTDEPMIVNVVPGPDRILRLLSVRTGADIDFHWDKDDKSEAGYRVYAVSDKRDIYQADGSNASARRIGETLSQDELELTEVDAFPGLPQELAFYQVIGVCADGTTEGSH